MLRRNLTAHDPDVAGNPLLGVDDPDEATERLKTHLIREMELAGMVLGIGCVVGPVEEPEVHGLQQGIGPIAERRARITDHDQGRREPTIVHEGGNRLDRLRITGEGLEPFARAGVQIVVEESVDPLLACQGHEDRLQAAFCRIQPDDLQPFGGQDAPSVGGDVRRRGHGRRLPGPIAPVEEAIDRQHAPLAHGHDRFPGRSGIAEEVLPVAGVQAISIGGESPRAHHEEGPEGRGQQDPDSWFRTQDALLRLKSVRDAGTRRFTNLMPT